MTNDFLKSLSKVLQRDLDQLEKEVGLYPDPRLIWTVQGEIKNPAGNLCLHLCGNLQHFIGAILGNTGYIRNRDNEFAMKDVSTLSMIAEIRKTKEAVHATLNKLDPSVLNEAYPVQVFGEPMTTLYFLIHLAGHLNYHLGQVNYHRRLLAPAK